MQESGKEHKHQNPVFRHYHENPSKNREKFLLPQLTWKERFNTNIAEVTYAECNIDPISAIARRTLSIKAESVPALTVDFRVFKRGPAHVAGIIFSPDFWGSRNEALATFQRFEGDFEVWNVVVSVRGLNAKIEYVIFCDDFRAIDTVPRLYHTNGGETFRPVASL